MSLALPLTLLALYVPVFVALSAWARRLAARPGAPHAFRAVPFAILLAGGSGLLAVATSATTIWAGLAGKGGDAATVARTASIAYTRIYNVLFLEIVTAAVVGVALLAFARGVRR